MVVTPEKIREKLKKKDASTLTSLEKRIDAALEESAGEDSIWIDANIIDDLARESLKTLLDKYRANGWNVRYESDQRDGDAYIFTAKKQKQGTRISTETTYRAIAYEIYGDELGPTPTGQERTIGYFTGAEDAIRKALAPKHPYLKLEAVNATRIGG